MKTSTIGTWIKRILLGVLGLIGLLVVVVVGIVVVDANFGDKVTNHTNITYPGEGGVTLNGYLAEPEGEGTYPGILLIHEWWGLNEGITTLADVLAAEGYMVLAVDMLETELCRSNRVGEQDFSTAIESLNH